MMKTFFHYFVSVLELHAKNAVTYYFFCSNSHAVHNCYYYHYNPVRGYTLSYHFRAVTSCSPKRKSVQYVYGFQGGRIMNFLSWIKSLVIGGFLLGVLLLASTITLSKVTVTDDQMSSQNSVTKFKPEDYPGSQTCKTA